jgi:hypothetical protein
VIQRYDNPWNVKDTEILEHNYIKSNFIQDPTTFAEIDIKFIEDPDAFTIIDITCIQDPGAFTVIDTNFIERS